MQLLDSLKLCDMLLLVSMLLGLAAADARAAVKPALMQADSYMDSMDIFVPEQVNLNDGEGEYLCTSMLLPEKPLRLVGVDVLADPQAVDEVTIMGGWPGTHMHTDCMESTIKLQTCCIQRRAQL
jgi:hypothetical protein